MGDNHVLSPILPTHLESDKQDGTPDFPPRLIQRADALCYSLPMLAPDGSRCHVVVVGSFAAWGETMTALVREGFVARDEPGRDRFNGVTPMFPGFAQLTGTEGGA